MLLTYRVSECEVDEFELYIYSFYVCVCFSIVLGMQLEEKETRLSCAYFGK